MDEKVECICLGRDIGRMSGWDEQDTWSSIFLDLELNAFGKTLLPDVEEICDLVFNSERGIFATYDKDGTETIRAVNWAVLNKET